MRTASVLALFALALTGCVSARVERLSPATFPPIAPEAVTVFMDPGELRADSIRYTRLALIFTSGDADFTSADEHMRKAREEAAKIGANGMVVQTAEAGGRYNWFWGTSSPRESSVMAIRWSTVPVVAVQPPSVTPPGHSDVAVVEIAPTVDTLYVGEQQQLIATARASSGRSIEGKRFGWVSSADSIVSVSKAGLVTAHAVGSVVVTAVTDGVSGSASIVVLAPR